MFLRIRFAALAAAALAPCTARAQSSAVRAPVGCTYETCALRVEPAFLAAPRLLRGRAGVEVGSLGAFGGGVDTLLAGPELAATHARRYVSEIRTANSLALLSAAAFVVVVARTNWFRDDADDTDRVLGITATALAIVSIPFRVKAEDNLSRAVWFYNAAFAR
jgi:hypothetical protein